MVDFTDRPSDRTRRPAEPAAPLKADAQHKTAIALQYELHGSSLPRVIASGRGTLAEKILEIAFANGVKVREDRDLAELLAKVDIDSEIPTEALLAVAEILNYIYRANGKLKQAAPQAHAVSQNRELAPRAPREEES